MLRVNIYYGGRGLIEDSTIYVMNKLTEVLQELNVDVKKYNLYEDKRGISVLPKTLKEADAIILAASVEWFGIGGFLQQFLDSCWLYGDKEKIRSLYMMPVVISTTYGEKDAQCMLVKAWETLGGLPCNGICAYVADYTEFETNPDYALLIEKEAESFYRTFSKKRKIFPTSTNAVCENVMRSSSINLTPQESEQLSMYVSDDKYVKKQKQDIEELTQMFRGMLGNGEEEEKNKDPYITAITDHFYPSPDISLSYSLYLQDMGKALVIQVDGRELDCFYQETEKADADVVAKLNQKIFDNIVAGTATLQGSFMAGMITAKGEFKHLRTFDILFRFAEN